MSLTEKFPGWMESLTTPEQYGLVGVSLLAALGLLFYLAPDLPRSWRESHQIRRAARRLGARVLRNVALPDGMGGEISIDFLVLARDAIVVIGVKRYDGLIFGSTRTDEWTQTLNSRSYRFPNPDQYLVRQIGAVRSLVPKIPVRGLHLFTDNAVFPWDKPANVLQVQDLRNSAGRRPRLKEIPAELRAAWTKLSRSVSR